jgi:hypothetical protein
MPKHSEYLGDDLQFFGVCDMQNQDIFGVVGCLDSGESSISSKWFFIPPNNSVPQAIIFVKKIV